MIKDDFNTRNGKKKEGFLVYFVLPAILGLVYDFMFVGGSR